jgi:hypothetical protein
MSNALMPPYNPWSYRLITVVVQPVPASEHPLACDSRLPGGRPLLPTSDPRGRSSSWWDGEFERLGRRGTPREQSSNNVQSGRPFRTCSNPQDLDGPVRVLQHIEDERAGFRSLDSGFEPQPRGSELSR